MAITKQLAERWNRALLSIYYHGRKGGHALAGQVRPRRLLSLARAVDELVTAGDPEVIGPVRLALADLCRTRAAGPDTQADRQIERLATKFASLTRQPAYDVARRFAAISSNSSNSRRVSPADAYLAAIEAMIEFTPAVPTPRVRPKLSRYEVVPR
jgi:hypothetical protein